MTAANRCPSCEYDRTNSTRPVHLGDGLMHCGSCGSRWRTLQPNKATSLVSKTRQQIRENDHANIRLTSFHPHSNHRKMRSEKLLTDHPIRMPEPKNEPRGFAGTQISGFSKAFLVVMIAMPAAAFLGIKLYTALSGHAGDRLNLTDISFERMAARSDAVKVTGAIENNSAQRRKIRDVHMIIYSKNGEKLHQWTYKPPVESIDANSRLQFTSSVGLFAGKAERVEARLTGDL